jgi:hypothetical protein
MGFRSHHDCITWVGQVLASLPPELQKDVIESAKRRRRMQSRAEFMPVRACD